MSAFDSAAAADPGGFAAPSIVSVDVYTSAYRISGVLETRFTRVTEVLNQLTGAYLVVQRATFSEHGDPGPASSTPTAMVAVDEILVMVAQDLGSNESQSEMRIPKRPLLAHLALPPLRLTGTVYVARGSHPVDGLSSGNVRFIAMTGVSMSSAAYPELARVAPVAAVRRDLGHVLLVADEGNYDQLLADVLDEQTAERWLGDPPEAGG
jgi:hypothetical protein